MASSEDSTVSKAEYARLRGCTRAAVTKAIAEGRITPTSSGRIDPAEADEQWSATTRGRVDSRPSGAGKSRRAPRPSEKTIPGGEGGATAGSDEVPYPLSRARREASEAELARMEVERVAGRLIERDKVEPIVFAAFRALRDRLMAIPRRVAPTVSEISDLREIEFTVAEELRQALGDFERVFSDQLAARTAPPA